MSGFVNKDLEEIVYGIVSNGKHLTQENIAMRIDESLKDELCTITFEEGYPLSRDKFNELKSIPEGTNNLYRLKSFIEKFCNTSSRETCNLIEIQGVVEDLPSNDEGIEDDINELMGQLKLEGGKKKKKMKGGNPELLQQLLKLVHKGGNEHKGIVDVIIENSVAYFLNDWSC